MRSVPSRHDFEDFVCARHLLRALDRRSVLQGTVRLSLSFFSLTVTVCAGTFDADLRCVWVLGYLLRAPRTRVGSAVCRLDPKRRTVIPHHDQAHAHEFGHGRRARALYCIFSRLRRLVEPWCVPSTHHLIDIYSQKFYLFRITSTTKR